MATTQTHSLRSFACSVLAITAMSSVRPADLKPKEINEAIRTATEEWFSDHPTARIYIQLNKPLFQVGESVWFKVSVLATDTLMPLGAAPGCQCELRNSQGAPIGAITLEMVRGSAAGEFVIPAHARGGEYVLKAKVIGGPTVERKLIVHSYSPPQIKKRLDVLGKAYGPGDHIEATASFERSTGEPLARSPVLVTCMVDGKAAFTDTLTTSDAGDLRLSLELPAEIATDSAYLILRAKDGERTESISRTIPILTKGLDVAFYPEGGDLVAGLPSRVYFAATKPNGKPAKLEGMVRDDAGLAVAQITSFHHGMGCFELTPEAGRTYQLEVIRPAGSGGPFTLPVAKASGLVMRVESQEGAPGGECRIVFHTTRDLRDATVVGALRGNLLAVETLDISRPGRTVLLRLPPMQGCLRLSVLDRRGFPLCERLVYRDSGQNMMVTLTPNKVRYAPRETVTIDIRTSFTDGRPCAAELGVSVVDDRVLAFADDKTANLLTRVYLEAELPGEIVEPDFYLDPDETDSTQALDLLLGTRGWRRFRWDAALNPAAGKDVRVTDQVFADAMGKVRSASARRRKRPRRIQHGGGSDDFGGAGFGGMGGGDDFGGGGLGADDVGTFGEVVPGGTTGIRKTFGSATALGPSTPISTLARNPTWMRAVERRGRQRPTRRRRPRGGGEDDFGGGDFGGDDFGDEGGWGPDEWVDVGPCVTLSLDNIPLGEIIRYTCIAVGLSFQVEPHAVLIGPGLPNLRRKASTEAINRKLRDIVVPCVEFEETPVDEIVKVLKRRSIELDPDGEGVNIMLFGMDELMVQHEAIGSDPDSLRYHWTVVREFPQVAYETTTTDRRDDFRECIHWEPTLTTNVLGHGQLTFCLSDATTSFRLTAEGNAGAGLPGRAELVIDSRASVHIDCDVPPLLSAGDLVVLPVQVTNEGRLAENVRMEITLPPCLKAEEPLLLSQDVLIQAGERRTIEVPLRALAGRGDLTICVRSVGLREQISHPVEVRSFGFPGKLSHSGLLRGSREFAGTVPYTLVPGSLNALIRFYPTPLAGLEEALQSMLRMPTGCFEQTSSSTHPNILITDYLRRVGALNPELEKRTQALLAEGYRKLLAFQCPDGGFGWYGKDAPSTSLTAYGIMQLTEMARVFDGVDSAVSERAKRWLLTQRNGKGGFTSGKGSGHRFGSGGGKTRHAYTVWALTEAGVLDIAAEVEAAMDEAGTSDDPYVIALALLTANRLGKQGQLERSLATKLAMYQKKDGSFFSKYRSFTGASGKTMAVESTALAIMALRGAGLGDAARKAVLWLAKQRTGGRFGSTQATVLALRALMAVEPSGAGKIEVVINGKGAAMRHVSERQLETARLEGLADLFKVGDNTITLQFGGDKDIGYSIDLRMMTTRPANEPDSPLQLTLSPMEVNLVQAGVVEVVAEVRNVSEEALGMTIVKIGVPAGMRPVLRQLEELKDDGKVALFETTPSEVVLYLDDVPPGGRLQTPIRLHADRLGTYSGPASCAYVYYNEESRWWVSPLKVTIGK
ncbi:MAG: hypothetical protein HOJ57_03790 [Lentisphaerae bacterium]|mgnify:CR=1 FL=1|jgi:hypothetical protein|nr:hypothetical protein [Lentisphaerota bacterium]MBT4815318.1 hypothetical protein [Lentisphaerota bacterium]MBT5605037.1 hypothetical protein [Lentisphaerota bacterium]MBT7058659.1 hypothetical protein [Lentisphaerota bacterium]